MKPDWGVNPKAVLAECMAATLFVFIGCGTATTFSAKRGPQAAQGFELGSVTNRSSADVLSDIRSLADNLATNASWGILTALAFGLAITVLAYATAHLSGGQINPAVTLGLLLSNNLGPLQAICNMAAQIVGAILGAGLLYATIPGSSNSTLASNQLATGVGVGNALCGEIVMTFVLVSVVLEVTSNRNPASRAQAPLAIGFAVFCGHAVMLPIDGCSINPARSLGPAIVSSTWPGTFWVFIVGPFAGAILAVPFHLFFASRMLEGRAPAPDPLAQPGTGAGTESPVGKARPGGWGDSGSQRDFVTGGRHAPVPDTPRGFGSGMERSFVGEGVLAHRRSVSIV
ncbi:hypothetical protein ABPG77_008428 [Micractinium sp. CCAP 211/92]